MSLSDAPCTAGLVRAARGGDRAAFAELVARFDPMIRRLAVTITRSAEDADDVAQQTWLALLEKIDSLQQEEALPGWLATTARREALHVVRRRGRSVPLDGVVLDRAEDPAEGPEDQVAKQDLAERVRRALEQLPRQRRNLLIALVGQQRPYVEVSAEFAFSVGSLGPLRARCLQQFARALASCGGLAA